MMASSCKSVRSSLSRYADGELAGAKLAQLERHLASCPACAEALKDYQALNALLAAPDPIDPDPYLWTKVRQAVAARRRARPRSILARLRPFLVPLAGVALVLVAVFTASQLGRTITATAQERSLRAVNVQPEDERPAVLESIPSAPEDTIDGQQ
jgi:anti-sigma factor RsiW